MRAVRSFIRRCFKKDTSRLTLNRRWQKRNKEGKCGKCGKKFTDSNPDFGGGQCQNCWASWG